MKSIFETKYIIINMSPSVWREWIEIHDHPSATFFLIVSLRVEGVD